MSKKSVQSPKSLVGLVVNLETKDRVESEYLGVLLTDLNPMGATVTWDARGITTTAFFPLSNLSYLSHRDRPESSEGEESEEATA